MEYDEILRKRIHTLCQARGFSYNKLALTFNMTLAEFLDFPELNDFCFDEDT